VDEAGAARATSEISGGFEAARTSDGDRTKSAADAAREFLRPAESSRILRFLQAIWIGSGASPESFPASVGAATDPGDEGLKFLIEHDEISDRDFWRALGGSLTIERLSQLGISGSSANLQHLVTANLDKLWAKAFRIRPDQPRLDETGQDFLWRMEFGLLALTGSNFTAYLGSNLEEIEAIKIDVPAGGVTVEELRKRARAVSVDSLELTTGQRVLTYGSLEESADVAKDDELAALANTLGSPTVHRATITVGGRHLDLDFAKRTASARTSGRPPLTDILGAGLPLLWPLAGSELKAFVSMIALAREQQTLELFPPARDE
jgi:hypothetical protein